MSGYVVSLDLGSSGMRARVVSTTDWRVVSGAERSYRVVRSQGGLALRFPPADLRQRIVDLLAEAALGSGREVEAIAITAQRGGTAFLDADGETVYVGPNRDVRAVFEGGEIDDVHGDEVYRTMGHLPSMFLAPAKLHWWRAHHPRVARRIATVASLGSWAAYQLTGELAETSETLAEAGLADVATGQPAVSLLDKLDLGLDLLPRLTDAGQAVGTLSSETVNATGLGLATRVVIAGPDAQIASLGAGSVDEGQTTIVAGWSAPVQRVTSQPRFDASGRTWVGRHVVAKRWIAEANPGETGGTLDAIRALLRGRPSAERFGQLAASASETAIPPMAFFGPRALDMSNPGMTLGGLLTPSPITQDGLERSAVARATFENIAFALRDCVELLVGVAGPSDAPVSLTGGMANSAFFADMLAATLGRAIRVHRPDAAALGAALLAVGAVGQASATAARGAMVEPTGDVPEADDRYRRWLSLRAKLDELAEEF